MRAAAPGRRRSVSGLQVMKIVADRAIPCVETFFSTIGEVVLCDGREITGAELAGAEVLLVRTVTPVNAELLENSSIRLVASATSGHDHVDLAWLQANGIGFAGAPGSNARSVAEYVLSSLFVLADQQEFDLREKSVGIIGCGHVGSTLLSFLETLGVTCLVHDPPLQALGKALPFHPFDEVLTADVVTLHVPLVTDGPYPTAHLVGEDFLSRVRPDVILLNTARGGVVDEKALAGFADAAPHASLVLDVWENEPAIHTGLLQRAAIATPHIAGYSTDGKLRATWSVYRQVCRYFGLACNESLWPRLPDADINRIDISAYNTEMDAVQMLVLAAYDVRSDSASLRRILEIDAQSREAFFMQLRNNYPLRREFPAMSALLPENSAGLREKLTRLGFTVN